MHILTVTEAAEVFGVSKKCVHDWIKQGAPVVSNGRPKKVNTAEIFHWRISNVGDPSGAIAANDNDDEPQGMAEERLALMRVERQLKEVKLKKELAELVPVEVLPAVLARQVGDAAPILDSIPVEVQRRCPDIPKRALHVVRDELAKARNSLADTAPDRLREALQDA